MKHSPVAGRMAGVFEQRRTLVLVVDRNFDCSIIIDIAECRSARGMLFEKCRTRGSRKIAKFPVAKVFVQDCPVFVVDVDAEFLDLGKNVTVDQTKVFPAIQIEIEETRAPANVLRVLPEPRSKALIVEFGLPAIVIQGLEFIGE